MNSLIFISPSLAIGFQPIISGNINSGCAGMTSEDTVVPFPYVRLIVGKRHCRVLILGYINSDSTGIDNGELGRI